MAAFPAYDFIKKGDLEWKIVDINSCRKCRLVLCSNEYIDCKFGEIENCKRFSSKRDSVKFIPRNNSNNMNTNDIIKSYHENYNERTDAKLMVVRLPYSNTRDRAPVIYEDRTFMSNPNCTLVELDYPSNFKFYIEDVDNEATSQNQEGRPIVTGRIIINARKLISLNPVTYEENTAPILELDFRDRVDVYSLDGISIFYNNPVNTLIDPLIFDVRFYLNCWKTIINGEATEGYRLSLLQGLPNDNEQVFQFNATSLIFVKVCINKELIYITSTSQIPHPTARVESFRQEIETMGYISSKKDLSIAGSERLTVLESVISDLNNVYILSPFRAGKDMMDWIFDPFLEIHAKTFLKRASSALVFLHSLGVSHNDLSMENFISADGSNLLTWVENVCICDYGQSKLHPKVNDEFQPLTNIVYLGKPQYCPPEISNKVGTLFGFKVDTFQLGMTVLYSLLPRLWQDTCRRAHVKAFYQLNNEDDIKIVITKMNSYCRKDLQLSEQFLQLMSKMLIASPDKRISMQEIHDHQCLSGV